MRALRWFLAALAAVVAITASGVGAEEKLDRQRCPRPAEFASVFSFGYGGDSMPKEDDRFEALLKKLRAAGFNTIHCTYTEKRLALCRKHGIKMMIDLLAGEHHVYKAPEKARAVCEKVRKDPAVWGYNIWNDPMGKKGWVGRRRDISTVRKWDPTHPAYCGTYRTGGSGHLNNADMLGYYDFHWKRGIDRHFGHLLAYRSWASQYDARFCAWLSASSGRAGAGNFNRNLYSVNTSIACGLKGVLWFLGGDLMNPRTLQWTEAGRDIARVNREIMPLRWEVARLGNPTAVYSTPVTRTANNKELPGGKKEAMPAGLAGNAFPKEFWLQPAGGEFVAGIFKDGKRDMVFLANHNAYAGQKVVLKVPEKATVSLFDRKTEKWRPVEVKAETVRLELGPGGGELLRFGE